MTHSKYGVALLAALSLTLGVTLAAAQQQSAATIGSTVTLTSCVEKSPTSGDKFILTHVADVPAHPATKGGRVVYWIDKVDKLKSHVGHQIRLMGKITDVDKEEMEVKLGEAPDGGAIVEIEGPGKQVKATPGQAGVSANQAAKERDIPTTLVKLKLDKVEMVAANCQLATR
jgi:hypothetical protein